MKILLIAIYMLLLLVLCHSRENFAQRAAAQWASQVCRLFQQTVDGGRLLDQSSILEMALL